MRLVTPRCSIVIAAAWNQAIFTPDFAKIEIFGGKEVAPEFNIAAGAGGFTVQYAGEAFAVTVRPEKLVWVPAGVADENFAVMEEATLKLLRMLTITPIWAVGVNLGFEAQISEGILPGLFSLPEEARIHRAATPVLSTSIKRSLQLDGPVLNLTMERPGEGSLVKTEMNFHHLANGAPAAIAVVESSGLTRTLPRAVDRLRSAYDLTSSGGEA